MIKKLSKRSETMQKKILFVDDESSLRRTMTLGLSQRGIDTEPCENGVNALKKLESFVKNNIPLDGIVVDIKLPDINGINLVKIMKFKYPGIPIILITGYADRYNMEEIKNLKISAFMEKPFTPDELTDQFVEIINEKQVSEAVSVQEDSQEAISKSAYMLLKLDEDVDFFETYQKLYNIENVLYCDATKGNYDVFLLVQAESLKECHKIAEEKIKSIPGIKEVEFLDVENPVLDNSTKDIINTAESALEEDEVFSSVRSRDMGNRVCSYILMEVEREKLENIYPTLRLDENVVYCDYTTGKYNLVLFVTGNYYNDIDKFITEKIISMDGVLKVKEYPVINIFEM
jgi:CheY-like chemotaxis protein